MSDWAKHCPACGSQWNFECNKCDCTSIQIRIAHLEYDLTYWKDKEKEINKGDDE